MRMLGIATIQFVACLGIFQGQGPGKGDTPLPPAALGSPITLEDGPDSTKFLDCAAPVLRPDFRHHDNQGALENPLTKPAPARSAVIAGHGHPGQICTSNGIDCVLPQQSINAGNQPTWQGWAGAWPGRFRGLTILACDTGEGPEGVQLLKLIAVSAKMPVRAPTDFIWCGNNQIVMDENAQWQEVTHTSTPDPIRFKTRTYEPMTPQSQMQIGVDGAIEKVPFAAARLDAFSALGDRQPVFREQPPASVESLLAKIDFREPLITSYVPDADVTARFELVIEIGQRSLRKRYVVLNDRLINDTEDRRIYYHTSSSFTEQLQALRRR